MKPRYIICVLALLSLTACADLVRGTAPGAALPSTTGIAVCWKRDAIGRCKDWSEKSHMCVNPKGIDEPEPLLPCSSLHP